MALLVAPFINDGINETDSSFVAVVLAMMVLAIPPLASPVASVLGRALGSLPSIVIVVAVSNNSFPSNTPLFFSHG